MGGQERGHGARAHQDAILRLYSGNGGIAVVGFKFCSADGVQALPN